MGGLEGGEGDQRYVAVFGISRRELSWSQLSSRWQGIRGICGISKIYSSAKKGEETFEEGGLKTQKVSKVGKCSNKIDTVKQRVKDLCAWREDAMHASEILMSSPK